MTRFRHGSLFNCEPSRFIQEIDASSLEIIGARGPVHSPQGGPTADSWNQGWSGGSAASSRTAAVRRPQASPQAQQLAATRLTPEADFVPDDTHGLQVGMQVEHQRFGLGKVVSLEGAAPDTKATIFFQGLGQKQILLKFAKIKIIT